MVATILGMSPMIVAAIVIILLAIFVFLVTDPMELIILAVVGALVMGMYTGRI
ncbi:unnamed protein product [marine sediment metagenome]|uniref:Uncharacterized protein n=1 Tax=marine sediment metagenome TaxID=412755 RepID=X1JAN5_9ZZZZ